MPLDRLASYRMKTLIGRISNRLLSAMAGLASFLFTLLGFLLLRGLDQQIAFSLGLGLFALLVVWTAAERPNSRHARAVAALIDRLMAVRAGDLASPAPMLVREEMPDLAAAVDGLFEQVRSNLADANAMALYDPVTALPNRLHFRREAERMLAALAGQESALLFVDLRGFKAVNDRLGHACGDRLLAMVADRMRELIKAESREGAAAQPLIARLAGDEFTILLPQAGEAAEAERIGRRLLAALAEPFKIGGGAVHIGGSIGIALSPDHGSDLSSLMKAADIALSSAKASGRARLCVYGEALASAWAERDAAEALLRGAVDEEALQLAYQPQVSLRSGSIDTVDAVLRWRRQEGELPPPDSFIALADGSGIGAEIGDWSIDLAGETLARWRAAGMRQRLCLKLSLAQLERADFFVRLRDALSRSGPPPWPVELSLPEPVLLRLTDPLKADLAALREAGVTIAIDDFGAAFTALGAVRGLAADRIRLAGPLVAEVDRSQAARDLAAALVHLIHELGCLALAEGVERYAQLDVLRAIGCDVIQGGSIAEPMGERIFVGWIERQGLKPLAQAS